MDYKGKCLKEIETYLRKQDADDKTVEFLLYTFEAGFNYGSLNGATVAIQEAVVKDINKDYQDKFKNLLDKL